MRTALVGLVVSLAITVVAWLIFRTLLVFLFVPFVPFLFRRRGRPPVRRCPTCGYQTRDSDDAYCPRDGTALVEAGSEDVSAPHDEERP